MNKILLMFVLGFNASVAGAQSWPFELWHEGKVVTIGNDTLKGLVKYDLQQDLIMVNPTAGTAEAFGARKILFVEIFDKTVHRYRQFYSLPYAATGNYKTPVLFELLTEGKLTLLARESLEYRNQSSSFYYNRMVPVLVYSYFLLEADGSIVTLRNKRDEILERMKPLDEEVQRYARSNRLQFENHAELIRIFAYYNSISN